MMDMLLLGPSSDSYVAIIFVITCEPVGGGNGYIQESRRRRKKIFTSREGIFGKGDHDTLNFDANLFAPSSNLPNMPKSGQMCHFWESHFEEGVFSKWDSQKWLKMAHLAIFRHKGGVGESRKKKTLKFSGSR